MKRLAVFAIAGLAAVAAHAADALKRATPPDMVEAVQMPA
jgi:hypothetical protein